MYQVMTHLDADPRLRRCLIGRPGHPEDAQHSRSYHPTSHRHPSNSVSDYPPIPSRLISGSGAQNNPFIPSSSVSATIRPVPNPSGSRQGSAASQGSTSSNFRGPFPVDSRDQQERAFGTFATKTGMFDDVREEGQWDDEEKFEHGYPRGHGYVDSVDSSRSTYDVSRRIYKPLCIDCPV